SRSSGFYGPKLARDLKRRCLNLLTALFRHHFQVGNSPAEVGLSIVISYWPAIVKPDAEIFMRLGGDDAWGLAFGDGLSTYGEAQRAITTQARLHPEPARRLFRRGD